MSIDLNIVRIFDLHEEIVGAGCLIMNQYILTCAHVVADALNIPHNTVEVPTSKIFVDFVQIAPNIRLSTQIVFWNPVCSDEKKVDRRGEDIVILEIIELIPQKASPARLASINNPWGRKFRVFGFPVGFDDGKWASGVLRDKVGNGLIQIEDVKLAGSSVEPGFSGSPVWDEDLEAVVGIIVSADNARANTKIAFMLPIHLIAEIYPPLKDYVEPLSHINKSFDWQLLRELAHSITVQRTARIKRKYNQNLYLQREFVLQSFEDFLVSDYLCFVVIGNSGVGKSCFVMSLLEKYSELSANFILLVYSASSLSVEDSHFVETINRDFQIKLNDDENIEKDIFTKIQKIRCLDQQVILIIDAINEASNPKKLLQQVNSFLETYAYPWLKICITSRPEAWKSIRFGVGLAESFYYRVSESDLPGLELKPFSFSQEISEFETTELPKVYEKYRQVYSLKTSYQILSFKVKSLIRDPLLLLLISRTFHGRDIPQSIFLEKIDEIFRKYLHNLIECELLYDEDLQLLTNSLIPLMIQDEEYRNEIDFDTLQSAMSPQNIPLRELLFQTTRDYKRSSFQNLADAGILEKAGNGSDSKIIFKYERLYEYFVSKYIVLKFRGYRNIHIQYQNAISKVIDAPWLWGTLQKSLVQELLDGNISPIIELSLVDELNVKNILVSSLEEFARIRPESAVKVLRKIIIPGIRKNKLFSIFIRRSQNNLEITSACRLALDAAYRSGLPQILIDGAQSYNISIRSTAIQYLISFWKGDRQETSVDVYASSYTLAVTSLNKLVKLSFGRLGIPNFTNLGSIICISCIAWFENHQNQEVLNLLRNIWRPIFKKYFFIQQGGNKKFKLLIYFLDTLLFLRSSSVLSNILDSGKEINSHLNIFELSQFFKLDSETRNLFRDLVPFLDAKNTSLDDRQVRSKIMKIARCPNVPVWFLLASIFIRHTKLYPESTIQLSQEIFDVLTLLDQPPPALILQREIFRTALCQETLERYPEWLSNLRRSAWEVFSKHSNTFHTKDNSYFFTLSEPYLYCFYRQNKRIDSDFIESIISYLEEKQSIHLYKSILVREIPTLVSFQSIPTRFALEIITPLILCKHGIEVQDLAVESIAAIAIFDPSCVEEFLFEINLSYQLQSRIKSTSAQILGRLLSNRMSSYFTEVLLYSYEYQGSDFMKDILQFYADSKSLNQWISKLLKHTVAFLGQNLDNDFIT